MNRPAFAIALIASLGLGAVDSIAQSRGPTTMRDLNTGAVFKVDPNHAPLPTDWIDPDTGHRVIRLTTEDGSESLYFHQNSYTPDGTRIIFKSPTGLYTVDLATHKIEQILADPDITVECTGRKSASVYYMTGTAGKDIVNGPDRAIYCIDINTHQTRKIADIPKGGNIVTVNNDETLLAGSVTYPPPGQTELPTFRYGANGRIDIGYRRGLHLPMDLLTINIATGEQKLFNHSTEWLNHIQFSPTDPHMLMFCHEGPWNLVDRIWTIDVTGGDALLVHERTIRGEIAGHEFFSADGKTVWYDLQTPMSQIFWLAGKNLETGVRTWYPIQRSEWSVHYNVSKDGTLFAGDGGGPQSVAAPGNGQWIYLFRPMGAGRGGRAGAGARGNAAPDTERDQSKLIVPGRFQAEKLVNLAKHDYALEPNVSFTPDMKWIVFRSNMLGPSHVFAVEIAKAQ